MDRAQQDYDEKTAIDYAIQHGHTDCIRILQSYGIRRPASALSMAPPVSSASPQVLDEFGHVQMRRPNRTFSLSGEPTEEEQEPMSSANRLPADGQASHDGIQEEVSPSQCGDNAAHPHSEERGTSQTEVASSFNITPLLTILLLSAEWTSKLTVLLWKVLLVKA